MCLSGNNLYPIHGIPRTFQHRLEIRERGQFLLKRFHFFSVNSNLCSYHSILTYPIVKVIFLNGLKNDK